ncbi:hypothetical protein P152DRAFT_8561 [Eremomyces bilateralis CBS 781.70]|uniref:Uncharacterized protein n=1 Tax=Eremomyces bilateralis CBS 781.70 TaxID=1392243 RepID=A0A6G1GGD6_9PEZI|nr:uncharacterized protein P152DRAFT_8561 [Eremomyces bilateralis CBS 781.70]KAF1817113.1 hypothetical protein P152DRAFT_8561 [Eremomyces bilateralis CBS 781.70]
MIKDATAVNPGHKVLILEAVPGSEIGRENAVVKVRLCALYLSSVFSLFFSPITSKTDAKPYKSRMSRSVSQSVSTLHCNPAMNHSSHLPLRAQSQKHGFSHPRPPNQPPPPRIQLLPLQIPRHSPLIPSDQPPSPSALATSGGRGSVRRTGRID